MPVKLYAGKKKKTCIHLISTNVAQEDIAFEAFSCLKLTDTYHFKGHIDPPDAPFNLWTFEVTHILYD